VLGLPRIRRLHHAARVGHGARRAAHRRRDARRRTHTASQRPTHAGAVHGRTAAERVDGRNRTSSRHHRDDVSASRVSRRPRVARDRTRARPGLRRAMDR
jgi:hypothetical protein